MKQKSCCKRIAEYLCTNLDEEFSSPHCKEIQKHLSECSQCSSLLKSLKATIALYKNAPCPKLSRREQAQRLRKLLAHASKAKNN